jgi:NAD(P)-dependent dehydrogenase (short-subunit alcohol dehydrogenase family)
MEIQSKAAIITGASRGLGRALMEGLARRGARVVGVSRHRVEIGAVAEALRAEGHDAHALAYDVGDKESTYPLAGSAAALVGPIDLLIHNASILGPTPLRLLLDTACEDLAAVLETNTLGPFRLTRAIAGGMVVRGAGLILHFSSDAAVGAYPGWGAYSVSKAALDHLGRIWAAELDGTGVRVLNVDPGDMDTKMHRDAIPDADPAALAKPEIVAERIIRMIQASEEIPSGSRVATQNWA